MILKGLNNQELTVLRCFCNLVSSFNRLPLLLTVTSHQHASFFTVYDVGMSELCFAEVLHKLFNTPLV
jgi:hypothetical protein